MDAPATSPGSFRFDLLILGGTLVDGTADAVPSRQDIGIIGDRIAAIGDLSTFDAARTLTVAGHVVAPGFIDPHVHIERALLDGDPASLAPVRQGVTTVLGAPDGFGWAPLARSAARELWTATAGIYGPWPLILQTTSVGAYLHAFEGRLAPNLLPQIPHAAVRFAAMGWDAGPATGRNLDQMRRSVSAWLDEGAAGLALGLDYEPGARACENELASLAALASEDGGTIAAHLRYQDSGRAAAWQELVRLGERTGCAVVVAHEILDDDGLELLESARERVQVSIETYLYTASSTHLAMFVPDADRVGGPEAIATRLGDPTYARRVAQALSANLGAELAAGERIIFAASADTDRVGRPLFETGAERQPETIGATACAVLRDDPDALFIFDHLGSAPSTATLARTIAHPATIVASDGIYRSGRMHPRGFGTFPRILRLAVREWGAISLPTAIHAMTGRTAARYRVPDRGVLDVGRIADVVIFDPTTVGEGNSWAEPTVGPVGIEHVFVAGRAVVRDGRVTDDRPGQLLAAA